MTTIAEQLASLSLFQSPSPALAHAAGTSDAITASFTPAVSALTEGMTFLVRAAYANTTTTPTFTPNSGVIPAKTIIKGAGAALAAGDIAGAGHWIELNYDVTLDRWVLLNPASSVTTRGVQRFTSNGSFTVPAGVTTIYVSGCGGGGGGGGSSDQTKVGSGGGGGATILRVPYTVTPGQLIAITVGAGGAGGTSTPTVGTSGGATTIGSFVTLNGGGGGIFTTALSSTAPGGSAGGSGGTAGTGAYSYSTNLSLAGGGGSSLLGASASTNAVSGAGISSSGYGAGGAGGISASGGNGSPGIVIIEW